MECIQNQTIHKKVHIFRKTLTNQSELQSDYKQMVTCWLSEVPRSSIRCCARIPKSPPAGRRAHHYPTDLYKYITRLFIRQQAFRVSERLRSAVCANCPLGCFCHQCVQQSIARSLTRKLWLAPKDGTPTSWHVLSSNKQIRQTNWNIINKHHANTHVCPHVHSLAHYSFLKAHLIASKEDVTKHVLSHFKSIQFVNIMKLISLKHTKAVQHPLKLGKDVWPNVTYLFPLFAHYT